jgi:hypothetical protein
MAITIFIVIMSWTPPRSQWMRTSFLGPKLRSTVGYSLQKASSVQDLEQDYNYMLCMHPHGLFCFSEMLTFVFNSPYTILGELALKTVPLVATELLWVPLLGHWACSLGCDPVDRENMSRLLEQKRSVALTPGGIREIKYAHRCSAQHITLRKTTGFLKLGFAKGTSAVPVLVLGESECYRFYPTSERLQNISMKLFGWPFPVLAAGRGFTFWPLSGAQVTLVHGNAVHPGDTEEEFIANYYAELSRIAQERGVELRYVDNSGTVVERAGLVKKVRSESYD